MELEIYSKDGVLKMTVSPSDNSTRQRGIGSDHVLSLSFVSFEFVRLAVNDYVDFCGQRFWITEEYVPKQKSSVEWNYECKFYGPENIIGQALVLMNTDGAYEPVFTLTAPASEHLAMVVENINRQTGTTDWKVGQVEDTEYLTITYEGVYCDEALQRISEAAGTEYWFDGLTVNLCRCEYGEAISLKYNGGGLNIEVASAENVKFFTRLFPVGSTRNIDKSKYGYTRLQLPDRAKYVEQDTHLGIVEHYESEAFSGIYPRRVGKVSSVRTKDVKDDDGKPFTIYYFKDADIPFDPNDYEIGGLVKHIAFQSGDLNGRDFEVNYDSGAKEFEIITQWPYEDDTQLPGGMLVPKSGDEYIIYNITLPDEWYDLAEQEYKEAVDAYMLKHRKDHRVYKVPTNYVDIEKRGLSFDIGQRIRLESDEYFPETGYRESRVTSFSQNVNRPSKYDLEVSDVLSRGTITTIQDNIEEVRTFSRSAAGSVPAVIRSWENTPASDFNIFSAKKSIKEHLSRLYPDVAAALIKFLDGIEIGEFISGIETGTGASIDREGNAEMTSLVLRSFLKVPQLIYNKVSVTGGEMWNTEGAVIKSVTPDPDSDTAFVLELELEDNETVELAVDDICKGHYNTSAGFITSYFRVTAVDEAAGSVRIVLGAESEVPGGVNAVPVPYMNIARYGNFTNEERQRSQYFSSSEQRISILSGVDQYIIQPRHYAVVLGAIPPALTPDDLPISGKPGVYLDNVLARNFFQIDKSGNVVRVIRDRALWNYQTALNDPYLCNAEYQDEVYHKSCKYRCIVEGTTQEPRYDSTDWLLVAGDTTLSLEIESSDGETFLYGQLSTTLTAVVKRGVNDVTSEILDSDWTWSRDTGDTAADAVWNTDHASAGKELVLTNEDLSAFSGKFICQVYVRDGAEVLSAEIDF